MVANGGVIKSSGNNLISNGNVIDIFVPEGQVVRVIPKNDKYASVNITNIVTCDVESFRKSKNKIEEGFRAVLSRRNM